MEIALNKVALLCDDLALNKVAPLSSEGALKNAPGHSEPLTLTIENVASAMGLTPTALMRKHRRLSNDHGFPPPLPGGVWRWSRAAFEAWVRANGAAPARDDESSEHPPANDRSSRLVREQNTSLRARYGAAR